MKRMREGCSNDVEALAHNLTRRLTMGRHSHRVNSLSEKDNATIRKWQETGRENLTERSRMYSQRESLPSDGTTSDVMTETSMHNVKEATDPLSSTNAQYAVELLKVLGALAEDELYAILLQRAYPPSPWDSSWMEDQALLDDLDNESLKTIKDPA